MTPISLSLKSFRRPESKMVGKVLFLLGVGLLTFSSTCLLGFKNFYIEKSAAILFLLVTSFVFILAGESIINLTGHVQPAAGRSKTPLRWMIEPVGAARAKKTAKHNITHRCFFCGIDFTLPQITEATQELQERDFDRLMFGVCLGCGKAVCPRCAYMKSMEMKVKSLHCPGCGSFIL